VDLSALPGKIYGYWQPMSTARKVALVLLAVSLIAGVYCLVPLLTRASYAPLLTQLDPKDAGAIVEKLKTMKVEYQLTDEGQTILVPKGKVYDARISLASSGVLEGGGKGFELFDQSKIGVTDFEQQVSYQRALQEELRRTIVQLEGVQQARVHLVMPQKSLFLDDNKETASASVALKLKPLARLTPEQVKGISDLVAGSVEGLKPENIHIIDMEGHVLSNEVKSGTNANLYQSASDQQQVKRNYEKDLEKRVQDVLERVLGPGKAVAMVTADLDFSQGQVVTNSIYGDPAVVSEKTIIEKNSKAGPAGGQAGTGSNLAANYPGLVSTSTAGDYSREEAAKNYQTGTRQETIVKAPADVRRLSVAVIMDSSPDASQIPSLQNAIAAAVGYNPERGDQIQVTGMAFDDSYRDKVDSEMNKADALARDQQRQRFFINMGAVAAGFLLLLFVLFRLFRMRGEVEEEVMTTVEGNVVPLSLVEKSIAQLENKGTDESITNPQQEKIKEMARKKPEDVAQIIKVWMAEES